MPNKPSSAPAAPATPAPVASETPTLVRLRATSELGAQTIEKVRYDIVGGCFRVPEALVAHFEALGCTKLDA